MVTAFIGHTIHIGVGVNRDDGGGDDERVLARFTLRLSSSQLRSNHSVQPGWPPRGWAVGPGGLGGAVAVQLACKPQVHLVSAKGQAERRHAEGSYH